MIWPAIQPIPDVPVDNSDEDFPQEVVDFFVQMFCGK
jgi:hypothetical protein